jgi:hypothetical protein
MPQTVHIDLDFGDGRHKRLRVDVTVCDDPVEHEPGTIVLVECTPDVIVADSIGSDEDKESVKYLAVVIKRSAAGMATVCWLLDPTGEDIKLHKAGWPHTWKRQRVRVLDTVSEEVPITSLCAYAHSDNLDIAQSCYDSKTKNMATASYTEFMLAVHQ